MTTTPTLDPQRTDQLRTFLVTEAAASVAERPPVLTPARRRVLAGATAVLVLGGAFVAVEAVGGPAPAAIAVEVDGEWTTVRIVDIDADPDAVVQQLVDAGFTAERQTVEVERSHGGGPTEYSVHDVQPDGGVATASMGVMREGGAHGVVGLTVGLPPDAFPSEGVAGEVGTADATIDLPGPPTEEDLEAIGVRFETDGGVSVRAGADVTLVVHTEA